MTDSLINILLTESIKYKDRDAYISDYATSSAFLDPEKPDQEIDMSLVSSLGTLWDVCNLPFRDFLRLLNLNQAKCSRRFCIPIRTVQGWAEGSRSAPLYIRLMMAELTGALRLPREG